MKGPGAGLASAAFVGIVPSYISRSVAGSYDNEGVAIFALMFVFFFYVKVRAPFERPLALSVRSFDSLIPSQGAASYPSACSCPCLFPFRDAATHGLAHFLLLPSFWSHWTAWPGCSGAFTIGDCQGWQRAHPVEEAQTWGQ